MSNYQLGAFEALQWTWHILRNYKHKKKGVEEARQLILEMLLNMGKGAQLNFDEKISKTTSTATS